MKAVSELLSALRRSGVRLWLDDGNLRYSAPHGVLGAEQLAAIRARKAEIVDFIDHARQQTVSTQDVISRRPRPKHLPLSYPQERLWLLDQLGLAGSAYNVPAALRLKGALDFVALERSFGEVVSRHETLRTRVAVAEGQGVQVIDPPGPFRCAVVDLTSLEAAQQTTEVARLMRAEAERPFDLARDALLRVRLLRLGLEHHVLLVTMQHIISDGWSIGILIREIGALYPAFLAGRPSPLEELSIQYADYTLWQRDCAHGEILARQMAYWKERLADAPAALELPVDRARPVRQSFAGGAVDFALSNELSLGLLNLSRRTGTTLYMVLLAALTVLLKRYSGQDDIVVGSPIAGRRRPELEGLIGCFLNTLALRINLSGDPTFGDLLGGVKDVCLGAYAHQDIPFEKLVEQLQPARDLSRQAIFQVMFALQNMPIEVLELAELQLSLMTPERRTSKVDLAIYMFETASSQTPPTLRGYVEYSSDLFDRETIELLVAHYRILLEGIIEAPSCRLSELPRLTVDQRDDRAGSRGKLVPTNSFAPFARADINQTLISRFESYVARDPTALAVTDGAVEWTYAELNQQANGIAAATSSLSASGSGYVALLFEQGAPMVSAMLATLKMGKAYVPLEPRLPIDRLKLILRDVGAEALIFGDGCRALAEACAGRDIPTLDVTMIAPAASYASKRGSLAYVLYTSGTTGVPKGVLQSDQNVLHFIAAYTNALHLCSEDRLTLFSSYSFDASVMDIYGALLNGASLHIYNLRRAGPGHLSDWLDRRSITVWHSTPTVFRIAAAQENRKALAPVRLVVMGGEETLPSDLALFKQHFGPACLFINGFGPTESTVTLQHFSGATSAAGARIPIGYPVEATRVVLLDREGMSTDFVGEIGICSKHIALGYLGRADLTADRFVPSPFGDGARLYRTGDLARRRADGALEYLGRVDRQVKIRGYRVELGEIEATITAAATVEQAVVVEREDASDGKQLIAYVIPSEAVLAEEHDASMRFGLFYFAESSGQDENSYRLYLEGAKLADQLGLTAVWTPERHFTEIAAAYPNPSVLSAALAMVTRRIQLRAGSVVLPLHDPVRVAEEWAAVDNLSAGRVGISFASGWVPKDFIFAPDAYADRHRVMLEGVEKVRRLWRGEAVTLRNGVGKDVPVKTLPRPIQPELPVWLTATQSPATFEAAGALGVNVLTALMNQTMSDLAEKIVIYRAARKAHGHNPATGVVSVMLHTFVGDTDEEALQATREPMISYFRSHAYLREFVLKDRNIALPIEHEDIERLLPLSLERYISTSSLIGSQATCLRIVERLQNIGVNEIACLVDFGIDSDTVLASLPRLRTLAAQNRRSVSVQQLRGQLAKRLPDYMMPSRFIALDNLPLMSNGKVDRRALAVPEKRSEEREYVGPRTSIEESLCAIWCEILKLNRVGVNDNFFQLGGHSLLVFQMSARVHKTLNVELTMREVFEAPTVSSLAERLVRRQAANRVGDLKAMVASMSRDEVKAMLHEIRSGQSS